MMKLQNIKDHLLHTYKVAHDAGAAPQPGFGICTLAICKPVIRRCAQIGDIIVGFGCRPDSNRIVYCMQVDEILTWPQYVARCKTDAALNGKIPKNENDAGDCIWLEERSESYEPLPSWSRHNSDNFQQDVLNGKNVLLAKKFWYFGKSDKYDVRLPKELATIIPNRGHQNRKNEDCKESFIRFFNTLLNERHIAPGKQGTSAITPNGERSQCNTKCRC